MSQLSVVCGKDICRTEHGRQELVHAAPDLRSARAPRLVARRLVPGLARAATDRPDGAARRGDQRDRPLAPDPGRRGSDELGRLADTLQRDVRPAAAGIRTRAPVHGGRVARAADAARRRDRQRRGRAQQGSLARGVPADPRPTSARRRRACRRSSRAFSRSRASTRGQAPPATHAVALGPLCEEVVRAPPAVRGPRGRLDRARGRPEIAVRGDAEQLRTSSRTSSRTRSGTTAQGGRVAVAVARANGHGRIRVDDTGIGISKRAPAARLRALLSRRPVALGRERRGRARARDREGDRRRAPRGTIGVSSAPGQRHEVRGAAAGVGGAVRTPFSQAW